MSTNPDLKRRRMALGLTQTEIARRAQCDQGAVSKLERGLLNGRFIERHVVAVLDAEERKRARLR